MKFVPVFDKSFNPISVVLRDFKKQVNAEANKVLKICVERNDGYNYVYELNVFADEKKAELNYGIAERLIKSILWVVGGYKIYISGDDYVYNKIKDDYTLTGKRAFDVDFMQTVYEQTFEVIKADGDAFPKVNACSVKIGGHLDGCRIGFDAGGSDRKVSAVIDGKVVYSEEVVWFPKTTSDYHYHYDGIMAAMKTAASKMPRVDAIGV